MVGNVSPWSFGNTRDHQLLLFFFVVGCGEDVDVCENSKPSLQKKKKKKKAQTQKIWQIILRGTWIPWLRRITSHKLVLGLGADLHGSLWTCILSGHSRFGGAAPSAPSPLASWRVLLPEISRQWVAQAWSEDQGSRPSVVSLLPCPPKWPCWFNALTSSAFVFRRAGHSTLLGACG